MNQTKDLKSYRTWQVSKRAGIARAHDADQAAQASQMRQDGKQCIIDLALADGRKLGAGLVRALEDAGYTVPDEVKK